MIDLMMMTVIIALSLSLHTHLIPHAPVCVCLCLSVCSAVVGYASVCVCMMAFFPIYGVFFFFCEIHHTHICLPRLLFCFWGSVFCLFHAPVVSHSPPSPSTPRLYPSDLKPGEFAAIPAVNELLDLFPHLTSLHHQLPGRQAAFVSWTWTCGGWVFGVMGEGCGCAIWQCEVQNAGCKMGILHFLVFFEINLLSWLVSSPR